MNMIRKAAITILLAGLAWPALAQPKIAIIDMNKVFESFYKTKAAKATLKDYIADLDKEGKALVDEFDKANGEYKKAMEESNNMGITAKEREKAKTVAEGKFKEVQEKQNTVELFNRRAKSQVDDQKRRMFEKIMEEIKTVVNSQAKSGSYTLVLDSTAETVGGNPIVLYNNGENDLTVPVITQLNLVSGATGGSTNSTVTPK